MKSRIPKFKSLKEEQQFWQTHDVTDFWEELRPVRIKFGMSRRTRTVRLTTVEVHMLQTLLTKLIGAASPNLPAHRKPEVGR